MSSLDYWKECLSITAEEANIPLTDEQLTALAEAAKGGHENLGQLLEIGDGYAVAANFARTLEQQRDEARAKLASMAQDSGAAIESGFYQNIAIANGLIPVTNSQQNGAATKGTELAAEIREKTNGLFATPPSITDAAKEIMELVSEFDLCRIKASAVYNGVQYILSRLLGAQAGEVKRSDEICRYHIQQFDTLSNHNDALLEECEQLRQDAKRLDWMESHNIRITKPDDCPPWIGAISASGEKIREAIDAAMQPSEEPMA